VDAFEDAIRAQLTAVPTMPATVIAERVGWNPWDDSLQGTRPRPAYLPPDPAGRTTYDAGNIAQCDLWFPPSMVPVGYGQTRSPMQLLGRDPGGGDLTVLVAGLDAGQQPRPTREY